MIPNNDIIQMLAKKIDKVRIEKGLSFQQMADLCEMDKAQVYNICTKGVDLRATSLVKIAKGLQIPIADIL